MQLRQISPKICSQQVGDPEDLRVEFQSETKGLKQESQWCKLQPKPRRQERLMSRLKTVRQREKILSYSNLCSIQAFNTIDDVHLHVGECIRILLRQTDRD